MIKMTKTRSKFFAISFFFIVMLAAFSNGWNNGTRLEVVHGEALFTLDEILGMEQVRVQSLQAPNTNINNINNYTNQEDKHVQIPAQSGKSLGSGNYIVTIGLGSPARELSLVIDTASDMSWTQCLPCYKHDCYPQKEPLFRPSESRSYRKIPCASQFCTDLGRFKRGGPGCANLNHECTYIMRYGDGSNTTGFYGSDSLTLISPFYVLRYFRFGCGNHNSGMLGRRYAGVFGLGRGPASFVSQRKYTYERVFSYCLPETNSKATGFLSFGPGPDYNHESDMKFTPFVRGPPLSSYYYIEITGIHVDGVRLRIPLTVFTAARAIIDSGTVLTHLPPAAYEALAKEYKRLIGPERSAPKYSYLLDTCFYITRNDPIPNMSFTFGGDATVPIERSGTLKFVKRGLACLAFAGNKNPWDMVIFGNTQQTKLEVLYDVANNRLGFRSNPTCM